MLPHNFLSFLHRANASAPDIFSFNKLPDDPMVKQLLSELQIVFCAWKKLAKMGSSSRKWSEADYAANLYALLHCRCRLGDSLEDPSDTMSFEALPYRKQTSGMHVLLA